MLLFVVMPCLFFVALWSPARKGLTSWLSCVLYFVTFPNVSLSTSESSKTGLSPPIKYFTDRSKAVLLWRSFMFFVLSCVCYVFVRFCLYVLCGNLLGKG